MEVTTLTWRCEQVRVQMSTHRKRGSNLRHPRDSGKRESKRRCSRTWESSSCSSHRTMAIKVAILLVPEACCCRRAVADSAKNLTTPAGTMDNSSTGCNSQTDQGISSRTTNIRIMAAWERHSQWGSGTKMHKSSIIMAVVILRINIR